MAFRYLSGSMRRGFEVASTSRENPCYFPLVNKPPQRLIVRGIESL